MLSQYEIVGLKCGFSASAENPKFKLSLGSNAAGYYMAVVILYPYQKEWSCINGEFNS